MTQKQEAYAVRLCRQLFGDQGRYLSQYRRELAGIGIKLRMRGPDKGEASAIISELEGLAG